MKSQFITNKKTEGNQSGNGRVAPTGKGQQKIQLYDEHPTNVISLHEFHSIALNRLQALRKLEFM